MVLCRQCDKGRFSLPKSVRCTACARGTYDHDSNASTPCEACSAGSFSGRSALQCGVCEAGQSDNDRWPARGLMNPSTH